MRQPPLLSEVILPWYSYLGVSPHSTGSEAGTRATFLRPLFTSRFQPRPVAAGRVTPSGFEPARERGVADEDGLAALGPRGDEADGHADLLGDELDVVARRLRQLVQLRQALG